LLSLISDPKKARATVAQLTAASDRLDSSTQALKDASSAGVWADKLAEWEKVLTERSDEQEARAVALEKKIAAVAAISA
jgi:hypothetical protein